MLAKVVLTLCVTIGLNTSLCTGGLFAFVGDSIQANYMTPAGIGYLTCEDRESPTDSAVSTALHGCKDAKACLAKTASQVVAKLHVTFHTVTTAIAPLAPLSVAYSVDRGFSYRHPVSPHQTSAYLAYSVVQRE